MHEDQREKTGVLMRAEKARDGAALEAADADVRIIGEAFRQFMEPFAQILQQTAESLARISAAQKVTNDRMEALERQVRLNTPVTGAQARHLGAAIRARAEAVLSKRGIEGPAAVKKLGAAIRKHVLIRYGIGGIREIPKHEYQPALNLIERWLDVLAIQKVQNAFRKEEPEDAYAADDTD